MRRRSVRLPLQWQAAGLYSPSGGRSVFSFATSFKEEKTTAHVYNGTTLVCHERSKNSRHDILHADLDQSPLKVIN